MEAIEPVKPKDFFRQHPVFRFEDFVEAHSKRGGRSKQTSTAALRQHVAARNLLHVRRGIYATVPQDVPAEKFQVDPYLLATQLCQNGVLAYHAALQFHGKAYSDSQRFYYFCTLRQAGFTFRGNRFTPVLVPLGLRTLSFVDSGVEEHGHAGGIVRVTSIERTLVDVLAAPQRAGGWEEVWRSLETIEFVDIDAVIRLVRHYRSAVAAARVGLFFELHAKELLVEGKHLEQLEKLSPTQPRYFENKRQSGRLLRRWNLVIPEHVLNRQWTEGS